MATNSLDWIDTELAKLEQHDLLRKLVCRETPQTVSVQIDGKRLINFSANDYLGLAADPRLSKAVADALRSDAWGAGASPLVTGRSQRHAELERAIARFEGTEAALLFPTGFAANTGTIAALVGRGDVVFSDQKNHASIIDGCRLSRAHVEVYPHADVDALQTALKSSGAARRRLIATDGLFSMDGDIAPLAALCQLAEEHDAMLLVDEAHATGVFGEHGRGTCEHSNVESSVDVRIGTLSKALGTVGGFVAGSQRLIDWLANTSRPYVFSTATPEAICAAAIQSLQIVQNEPQRRQELLGQALRLRNGLADRGWNLGNSASQIVPLFIGDPGSTMDMARELSQRGLAVPGIRPPTVPVGESLLRISLTYLHTREMIDQLIECLNDLRSNSTP